MHIEIPYYIYLTIFKKFGPISPTNIFVGQKTKNYVGLNTPACMEYHDDKRAIRLRRAGPH